jgi:hypothetical protein
MMKNKEDIAAQKQLIEFRDELHKLLIKYPKIQLASDMYEEPIAIVIEEGRPFPHEIRLPLSGKQELTYGE